MAPIPGGGVTWLGLASGAAFPESALILFMEKYPLKAEFSCSVHFQIKL